PMFGIRAQAHAGCGAFWLGFAVPAQESIAIPAGIIGPDGHWVAQAPANGNPALVIADLVPTTETQRGAIDQARPWRERARIGELHEAARVIDPRSIDRTSF